MQKTIVGAISGYFNEGDGVSVDGRGIPAKRPLPMFRDEMKALSDTDKRELAEGACAVMGWELKA